MSYQGFDFYSGEIVNEIKNSPYMVSGSVYDYAATQFSSYPAAIVTASDLKGQFVDTSRNEDHFVFTILLFMNRLNQEEAAEQTMRKLVDDIIQRLNNNATINGNQNTFGKPLNIRWGYAKSPDPDMRAANITYEIVVGQ